MSARPARHDLLRVTPAGWSMLFASDPDLAALDAMRLWRQRDLPVMARRPRPGDDPGALPVCIALPPHRGPSRLPFCLPRAAIDAILPPVRPADLLRADAPLPPGWRERLHAVQALAERMSLRPTLFGSLLWQHLTGLFYLRDGSDLDLLWRFAPGNAAQIPALLRALAVLDAEPGPRPDGEIHLAGQGAVSWRELALGRAELLLRTETEACLVPRARFLRRIAVPC